jgi:hypothetical protein
LSLTVCHLPPGISKWNKIEHRLFSHISMYWRGRPLTSHEVIVDLIAATTTRQGLRVHAERDFNSYPTSVAVSDAEMATVAIQPHPFHGEWNYTAPTSPAAGSTRDPHGPGVVSNGLLTRRPVASAVDVLA